MGRFDGVVPAGICVGIGVALVWLAGGRAGVVEAKDRTAMRAMGQSGLGKSAPTIQAYSRETVVDVTVTDKDGKPVRGLQQSDFTVMEDGKPEAIRSFKEFGSVEAVDTAGAAPRLPPNVHTNLEPPAASGATNILLLDFVNTAPDCIAGCAKNSGAIELYHALYMQHQAKQEAIKYLHEMPVGTRVTIIAMRPPASLRVLQGISSDPELLSAAVKTLDPVVDPIPKVMKIAMTLEALNQVAAVAAEIKGRKNLVWPTYGLAQMTEPLVCLCDTTPFKLAFNNLTAAQVTVYPVGVRGVYAYPASIIDRSTELASLESMAEAGGGVALYNSNDLESEMAEAVAHGSDFYTITYVPPGTQFDGRHHTIHVKVNPQATPQGVHLTYRDSYYAEDPAKMRPPPGLTLIAPPESKAGDMRVAMSRSIPPSTQMLFDVKLTAASEPPGPNDAAVMGVLTTKLKGKPLTRYDLLFALPAKQIAFVSTVNGTYSGAIEFDIVAYDALGNLVTSRSQTLNLPLTVDEYADFVQRPFQFFQQLDLPPGQFFVRAGILDRTSNKVGTMEFPLTVGKEPVMAGK
jgi:VWFA-related protein